MDRAGRVRLIADPDGLTQFLMARVAEAMELASAIDQALPKMTRR